MKGMMKMKRKRKRDCVVHHITRKHLEKKLSILLKTFKPIPFVPKNALDFSTHEALLKRAGLWDFVHTEFDSEICTDTVAQLVVGYNPDARPHSRSVVNGFLVKIDKIQMGCALGLPKLKGEESCGLGGVSEEEVLFLEKVIFNWVVLDGENGSEAVLDEVIKVLWKERRPEKVDWAELMWSMVERELVKGVELEECWYASHLQCFLRKVNPSLFDEEVEKVGYGRRGMIGKLVCCGGVKLESGEEVSCMAVEGGGEDGHDGQGSGVSDDCGGGLVGSSGNGDILRGEGGENEKVVKSLAWYQRRKGGSGRMVDCCEGLKLESVEEVSSLRFGHGGGGEEGNLEVLIFDECGNEVMERGLGEEGGKIDEDVESNPLVGLINDEDGLRLVHDEAGKEINRKCFVNGEEFRMGEVCEGSTGLIAEEGKEEVLKQDDLVKGGFGNASALKIVNEESGLLDDVADMKIITVEDDTEKLFENEDVDLLCKQGNADQLKSDEEGEDVIGVETGSSGDSYAMQGKERVGFCSVQIEQQLKVKQDESVKGGFSVSAMKIDSEESGSLDDVAGVKINGGDNDAGKLLKNEGVDVVSEQGKDDQLKLDEDGEDVIGVETGGSSDSYAMKQGNEQLRFCSVQSLHTAQELKVKEDLKQDDLVKGDVSAMQIENEKSGLLDDVAEDNGRKQSENGDVDLIGEQGKVDQLKLDEEDELVEISTVRTNGSGDSYAMKQENERVGFCSVLAEQEIGQGVDVVRKELDYEQAEVIEGGISTKVWEIVEDLGMKDNVEEMVLHDFVKEVEDGRISCTVTGFDDDDDSQSEEVVEVSDDDDGDYYSNSDMNPSCSPRYCSNINECSVIEPFVSGTKMEMEMASSDFLGNASKRKNAHVSDAFVEPFVLEHNLDADRSDATLFQNSLKTEIDLFNDGHKRQRTENQSCKEPMANIEMAGVSLSPLNRKMEHTGDDHGRRMQGNNQCNENFMDFNSCKEHIDMWLAEAKMIYASREETWISAQMKEQKLAKELEQLDNMIRFHETTKHEELRQRDLKINCLENSLFFVANQLDDYKKALQAINKSFAAFRERCEVPAEPLYREVKGSGASN